MNKKTVTLIALGLSIAAITYITYKSIGQLESIDYDFFATDEDEND